MRLVGIGETGIGGADSAVTALQVRDNADGGPSAVEARAFLSDRCRTSDNEPDPRVGPNITSTLAPSRERDSSSSGDPMHDDFRYFTDSQGVRYRVSLTPMELPYGLISGQISAVLFETDEGQWIGTTPLCSTISLASIGDADLQQMLRRSAPRASVGG